MNNLNVVKTLRLAEIEPSPIVAETLNATLWQHIKLNTPPPPTVFKKLIGSHSGGCFNIKDTESGEIDLHWDLQSTTRTCTLLKAKENLALVYIHELSHRLSNRDHDAVFATLNFCLLIRASKIHHNLWQMLDLYDFQNHTDSSIDMVDAFTFIFRVGSELAKSDLNTTELVTRIEERWKIYSQRVIDRPHREKRAREYTVSLQNQVSQLRADRFKYALYGVLGTLMAVLATHVLSHVL